MSSHPTKPSLSLYPSEIGTYPVLRKEEARQVAREASSGGRARTILVQPNLRLAVRIAVEYQNLGVPLEDLINEGNLGLLEAARRYDPGQGTTFVTADRFLAAFRVQV
jgi:RNA polymerase primary sigma factor